MTTSSGRLDASFIAAAAAPIADALATMGELGIPVPTVDVLISYTSHGCVVRVADRRAGYDQEVAAAFQDAFVAAGWGVSHCETGGLVLHHPSRLTRS
ncbi:hypothetical protein E1265_31265 [Streptomyces sp. 8K308]|uniref:hypothetical protein n=1 Tax=Streptomyces sp. 8K308 TaxID=2530388 RepID=UPI00104A92C4|nr:hypothetical protein [Streptomyces sp. 8K308]TDC10412.1 hypothetical protein E1265_31265 [Streptomyces sp. 8K308]